MPQHLNVSANGFKKKLTVSSLLLSGFVGATTPATLKGAGPWTPALQVSRLTKKGYASVRPDVRSFHMTCEVQRREG